MSMHMEIKQANKKQVSKAKKLNMNMNIKKI